MKKIFGGEKSEQYNAVYNAIIECGIDDAKNSWVKDIDPDNACYDWLERIAKTSLTAELVNKLNELGFNIIKNE